MRPLRADTTAAGHGRRSTEEVTPRLAGHAQIARRGAASDKQCFLISPFKGYEKILLVRNVLCNGQLCS